MVSPVELACKTRKRSFDAVSRDSATSSSVSPPPRHDRSSAMSIDARASEGKRIMLDANEACQVWHTHLQREQFSCSKATFPSKQALLPVFGAYNSGKSALLNEILGEDALVTAPVELTKEPWAVCRPETEVDVALLEAIPSVVAVTSSGALENITLLDTPGYGGVDAEDVMGVILPLCQAALLCISSQTPVTAHDVAIARRIAIDHRSVIVVLTKADLARDDAELSSVQESVRSRLAPALGHPPRVFAVATRPSGRRVEGVASSGSGFEFGALSELIRSLQNPPWLRPALLRSASLRLCACSRSALQTLHDSQNVLRESLENSRKALSAIDHSSDGILNEASLCRQRLRHQARELEGAEGLLDGEVALSAPLVAFRRQLEYATGLCGKELGVLTDRSVHDECTVELERFCKMSVEILRTAEVEMDSAFRSKCASSSPPSPSSSSSLPSSSGASSKALSYATATAAGLAIGASLGVGVGLCAAAVGLVSALGVDQQQQQQQQQPSGETEQQQQQQPVNGIVRCALGQPSFALDLVEDNISRLRTRLKKPFMQQSLEAGDQSRQAAQKAVALESVSKLCVDSIESELGRLREAEENAFQV